MNPAVVTCQSCRRELAPSALFCPGCGAPRVRDSGDDLLGKVLGDRFLIVERIGHGKSGTIYKGEHVTLRRRVAIKVLHDELSRDDLAVERFRREATSVAELDNEHIVEIHDFGRTPDNRLYMAMELLEGETLDQTLAREGKVDLERAADIMMQVGDALAFAHSVGFVHRDLRPRNIFLAVRRGKANFVKLLDFGLSKLVETGGVAASTSLGMTFGDPRYMSPEQAKGDAIDRRADIYSLGCIGYEMLTGAPPFVGHKVFEVLSKHVSTAPTPVRERRADVAPWLDAAVMRMLAKAPDDRFITAARMVEALQLGLRTGETMVDAAADSAGSSSRRGPTGTPAVGVPAVPPAPASSPSPEVASSTPAPSSPSSSDRGSSDWSAHAAPIAESSVALPAEPPPPKLKEGAVARGREPSAPARGRDSQPPPRARASTPPPVTPAPEDSLSSSSSSDLSSSDASGSMSASMSASASSSVVADPEFEAEAARAHARRKRASTGGDPGISGAWFDDDPASSVARARRTIDPGDGYDDEYAPEPRRWVKPALIAGGIALVGVLALLIVGGGKDHDKPAPQAAIAIDAGVPEIDAAPPPPAIDAGTAAVTPDRRPSTPSAPTTGPAPTRPAPERRVIPDVRETKPTPSTVLDGPSELDRRVGVGSSGGSAEPDEVEPAPPSGPAATGDAAKLAEFYARAGDAALRSGDAIGAASNYNKALESNASNIEALIGLGEVALQQGQYPGAIGYLKKALRFSPRSSRINTLLGEAYLNSGNATAAEAAFKKALQSDPDNARARNGYNEAAGRMPPPADDPDAP